MHHVKLPTQDAKLNNVIDCLSDHGYTIENANQKLIASADTALSIAIVAFDFMDVIRKMPKHNWVTAWNQNTILLRYFGEIKNTRQFHKAMRRLNSAMQLLVEGITVQLIPASASRGWGVMSAKTIKLFVNAISESQQALAALIVNELMSLRFSVKKLEKLAYGEQLAINLAISEPLNARRNYRIINTL